MKRILLLAFMCSLPLLLLAQDNQDYLLTMNKDTLFGKIKINPHWETITFVHHKKRVNFHATTIQYFGIYKDGKYQHYKSINDIDGTDFFVEILSEGKIKLYKAAEQYFRFARFEHFEVIYYVGSSDDELVPMSELEFNIFIKNIAKEFPHLAQELEQLSFGEFPKLVAMYNRL